MECIDYEKPSLCHSDDFSNETEIKLNFEKQDHAPLNKSSGIKDGGGQGGRVPPRDFSPGNFWLLIGKNVARKKDAKCRRKLGKMEKGRRKMRN